MTVTNLSEWRRKRDATSARRLDLNDTVYCGCGGHHFALRCAYDPRGNSLGPNVKQHHDGSVSGYTGVLYCTACGKILDGT